MSERNDNNSNQDGRYAIDLRLFLALIATTMAVSFMAGVMLVPPDTVGTTSMQTRKDGTVTTHSNVNLHTSAAHKEDEEHRPSGQHLLVDIKNVEGEFLNSEERLSKAMVDTVKEAGYVFMFCLELELGCTNFLRIGDFFTFSECGFQQILLLTSIAYSVCDVSVLVLPEKTD
jgi:hypothetical protein